MSTQKTLSLLAAGIQDITGEQLSTLSIQIKDEQKRRAVAGGDIQAIGQCGFIDGFNRKQDAVAPYLVGQILIMPGSIRGGDIRRNHRCSFVRLEDQWVWEHQDCLINLIKYSGTGLVNTQHSINAAAIYEGMGYEVIHSKMSIGRHMMIKATSYSIVGGEIKVGGIRTTGGAGYLSERFVD